jgi:hypothetical protein
VILIRVKLNYSKKPLFQCHTVCQKSHVAKPGTESGPRRSNPSDTTILLKIQIFWDGNSFDVSKFIVTSSASISASFGLIDNHHKHQELDPLIRSVSRVTTALANVSSVFQLFSFLVVCDGMISKGFGFVAFFSSVKSSSVFIHLSCILCM